MPYRVLDMFPWSIAFMLSLSNSKPVGLLREPEPPNSFSAAFPNQNGQEQQEPDMERNLPLHNSEPG